LDGGNDGVGGKVDDGHIAGNEIGDISDGSEAVNGDALRILSGIGAAGSWVVWIVQVNEPGSIAVHGEPEGPVGSHIQFNQKVACGGNGVGCAGAKLSGERNGPGVGKEMLHLSGFGIARAEVEVEGAEIKWGTAIGAGDDIDEGMSIQVETKGTGW